jgi:hypothetical protein
MDFWGQSGDVPSAAQKSGFQEEEEQLLSLVLAEFRAQTHQEIWDQRGKEDDRQHKMLSYIMQQQPPPHVHSLGSRMNARQQNQQKKQKKSQSRWCVRPTMAVAFLQWSSPPLLACSCNGKKDFIFLGLLGLLYPNV